MLLLVGLGNPGEKYARNRHNIGFMAVDSIAERHDFGPERARFQGLTREGRLGTQKVLALKPRTFMNESGRAVAEALRFYKLAPEDVVVFHDELDLAPGKLRVKAGGGHAGHNGLRSIHAQCGADYRRVRLGIGHPGDKAKVSGYVLHDFAKADRGWLEPMLDAIAEEAPRLADGDDARFQSDVARKLQPNREFAKDDQTRQGGGETSERAGTAQEDGASTPFARLRMLLGRGSDSQGEG